MTISTTGGGAACSLRSEVEALGLELQSTEIHAFCVKIRRILRLWNFLPRELLVTSLSSLKTKLKTSTLPLDTINFIQDFITSPYSSKSLVQQTGNVNLYIQCYELTPSQENFLTMHTPRRCFICHGPVSLCYSFLRSQKSKTSSRF